MTTRLFLCFAWLIRNVVVAWPSRPSQARRLVRLKLSLQNTDQAMDAFERAWQQQQQQTLSARDNVNDNDSNGYNNKSKDYNSWSDTNGSYVNVIPSELLEKYDNYNNKNHDNPSFHDMAQELQSMNQQAESTYSMLQQMESEVDSMMTNLQDRDLHYKEQISTLQSESQRIQDDLMAQLQQLSHEYITYKQQAMQQQQSTKEDAQVVQQELKQQIASLQQQLHEQLQSTHDENSKAQEYTKQRSDLDKQLINLQREATSMIDEFRTKYFRERDARYQDMKEAQEAILDLQEESRVKLLQIAQSGQNQLDREWVDYTINLVQTNNDLIEAQAALNTAQEENEQFESTVQNLHEENVRLQSFIDNSTAMLERITSLVNNGSVPSAVDRQSLHDLEQRISGIINSVRNKEDEYKKQMTQLRDNYASREAELSEKLRYLSDEYQRYKFDLHQQHLAINQAAKATQSKLQDQIAALSAKLEEQVVVTERENVKARDFLQKRLELERELSLAKKASSHTIANLENMYSSEKRARQVEKQQLQYKLDSQYEQARKEASGEIEKVTDDYAKELESVQSELKRTKGISRVGFIVATIIGLSSIPTVMRITSNESITMMNTSTATTSRLMNNNNNNNNSGSGQDSEPRPTFSLPLNMPEFSTTDKKESNDFVESLEKKLDMLTEQVDISAATTSTTTTTTTSSDSIDDMIASVVSDISSRMAKEKSAVKEGAEERSIPWDSLGENYFKSNEQKVEKGEERLSQ